MYLYCISATFEMPSEIIRYCHGESTSSWHALSSQAFSLGIGSCSDLGTEKTIFIADQKAQKDSWPVDEGNNHILFDPKVGQRPATTAKRARERHVVVLSQ